MLPVVATPSAIAPARSPSATQLDLLIAAWLDAKQGRSGSGHTARAYRSDLTAFRAALQAAGLDLDGDVQLLALAAQGWAGQRDPSAATYNRRLASLGSFYNYAIKRDLLQRNPIGLVERRPVDDYAGVRALDLDELRQQLAAIDRSTRNGLRDYALLAIYLQTGRRLDEVRMLEWRDVRIVRDQLELHFRRCKGGKVMRDLLPAAVSRALLEWLREHYKDLRKLAADATLWPSASPRSRGRALSAQGIRDIVEARIGTTHVHATRHTFAKAMEGAGAKVSDIQAKLGHSSLATTGRYLAALSSAENPQAEDLAALFGLA
ncbi:MAG TPA: tyrosine-type recombinase/integrase [Roseiflexaceae bacterium]|nr:tyrosine-type recombinase/integrase [Roseiflexaceae bacterium]